jgi:cytoskeletal protein RodZ
LSTFLPKKPTEVELRVIKEMFEASVDGQPYDTERWGQYFRPAGVQAPASTTATVDGHGDVHETAKPMPAPAAPAASQPWDDDEPAAATAPVQAAKPAAGNAQDILAMIRARQNKQ